MVCGGRGWEPDMSISNLVQYESFRQSKSPSCFESSSDHGPGGSRWRTGEAIWVLKLQPAHLNADVNLVDWCEEFGQAGRVWDWQAVFGLETGNMYTSNVLSIDYTKPFWIKITMPNYTIIIIITTTITRLCYNGQGRFWGKPLVQIGEKLWNVRTELGNGTWEYISGKRVVGVVNEANFPV